jgi:GNAT superfamily N-acetyltransferase
MALAITPVSVDDPDSLAAYCAVVKAVRDHDMPRWRDTTPRMAELQHAIQSPSGRLESHIAWRDGEPVGRVSFGITTQDNLDVMDADIWVIPAARRQGVGRELFEFSKQMAARLGRKRLFASSLWPIEGFPEPDLAGVEFANWLGAKPSLDDVARRLDLATADTASIDALFAGAQEKSAGYHLVQWIDAAPEEYAEDLAYLSGRLMTDAPMGELNLEAPKIDVARLRESEAAMIARERIGYHTGAVHTETGRMVAWTTITMEESLTWHGFQQITIVEPEHRGHRLGALVKVANLRFIQSEQPAVTAIDTFNAADNTYMIAINEAMGFRPLYSFQNWQLEL